MASPDYKLDRTDRPQRRWSRRRVLRGLALAGAAMVADELWWEPWRLVVERVTLAFPGLPAGLDGLRLVQLSDLHRSHTVGQAEIVRAVERANALQPDLVVLTGDSGHARGYVEPCAAALAGFGAVGAVRDPGQPRPLRGRRFRGGGAAEARPHGAAKRGGAGRAGRRPAVGGRRG